MFFQMRPNHKRCSVFSAERAVQRSVWPAPPVGLTGLYPVDEGVVASAGGCLVSLGIAVQRQEGQWLAARCTVRCETDYGRIWIKLYWRRAAPRVLRHFAAHSVQVIFQAFFLFTPRPLYFDSFRFRNTKGDRSVKYGVLHAILSSNRSTR